MGPGTRTWDQGSGTLHLGPFTRDPRLIGGPREPGPLRGTRDLGPGTRDPII